MFNSNFLHLVGWRAHRRNQHHLELRVKDKLRCTSQIVHQDGETCYFVILNFSDIFLWSVTYLAFLLLNLQASKQIDFAKMQTQLIDQSEHR